MKYIALDVETTLIPQRQFIASKSGSQIFTSPYVTPELVLGTAFDGMSVQVFDKRDFITYFLNIPEDTHLVFHNSAFDLDVLGTISNECNRTVKKYLESGIIHDTMVLDILLRLAAGMFDMPTFNRASRSWSVERMANRSLDIVAHEYTGIILNKDETIRLTFGQYLNKSLAEIPKPWIDYAKQDAIATYKVFECMLQQVEEKGYRHMLSEQLYVRTMFVERWMDKRGISIDMERAKQIRRLFEDYVKPQCNEMATVGIGSFEPVRGTIKKIRVPMETELSKEWTPYKD